MLEVMGGGYYLEPSIVFRGNIACNYNTIQRLTNDMVLLVYIDFTIEYNVVVIISGIFILLTAVIREI